MPDWPHSPVHRLDEKGTYFVTGATYLKEKFFRSPERLRLVHDALLKLAADYAWNLQAWAVMANHYHFVGISPDDAKSLRPFLSQLHMTTAKEVNRMDGTRKRKVWFQYRDTQLTYERSFLARLKYTHTNPVHHGLVRVATQYPWCSAAWFERNVSDAFRKTVMNFNIDRLNIDDDF